MDRWTGKQVVMLLSVVVGTIAFVETSVPIMTVAFVREFLLKLIVYVAASVVAVMIVGQFIGPSSREP